MGIALQVVLETLGPAERLAFVLHDMFAVPFDEIAAMLERSPQATRQLASRARRRVRDAVPSPDPDLTRQCVVVDAYFAAAREGDIEALAAVLDPDVVRRAHRRDCEAVKLLGAARVMQRGDERPALCVARPRGAVGCSAHDRPALHVHPRQVGPVANWRRRGCGAASA